MPARRDGPRGPPLVITGSAPACDVEGRRCRWSPSPRTGGRPRCCAGPWPGTSALESCGGAVRRPSTTWSRAASAHGTAQAEQVADQHAGQGRRSREHERKARCARRCRRRAPSVGDGRPERHRGEGRGGKSGRHRRAASRPGSSGRSATVDRPCPARRVTVPRSAVGRPVRWRRHPPVQRSYRLRSVGTTVSHVDGAGAGPAVEGWGESSFGITGHLSCGSLKTDPGFHLAPGDTDPIIDARNAGSIRHDTPFPGSSCAAVLSPRPGHSRCYGELTCRHHRMRRLTRSRRKFTTASDEFRFLLAPRATDRPRSRVRKEGSSA